MSTTAKVAIGLAAAAAVYFVVRARAAANEANSYTISTPPAPAPIPTAQGIANRGAIGSVLGQVLHPTIAVTNISTAAGHAVGVWRA